MPRTTQPLNNALCLLCCALAALCISTGSYSAEPTLAEPTPSKSAPEWNVELEVERFKRLIGASSLSDFEVDWRAYMQDLAAGKVQPVPQQHGATHWPKDRLTMRDGEIHQGVLLEEEANNYKLLQIVCRPGKPLYMLSRRYDKASVAQVDRLSDEQRANLLKLIDDYRHRNQQLKIDKNNIQLGQRQGDFNRSWRTYRGEGFVLESTADEDTMRTVIVRIDQRMQALRQYLPPHIEPQRPLTISLLGSRDEYATYLAQLHIKVSNVALYDARQNQVIAFNDRDQLTKRWETAHAELRAHILELERRKSELAKALAAEAEELRKKNFPQAAITELMRLRQVKFNLESQQKSNEIIAARRKNERLLEDMTEEAYRPLYHELFHAYLENFVFVHASRDVPRWLNEGLAQVFESGQMESGTLRIDAPDPVRLEKLTAELSRPDVLSLRELFSAPPQSFLAIHGQQSAAANRLYLYSWGVAYYLAFARAMPGSDEQVGILGTPALNRYVLDTAQPAAVKRQHP